MKRATIHGTERREGTLARGTLATTRFVHRTMAVLLLGTVGGPVAGQTSISVAGAIESQAGGLVFPDGSVQMSSATPASAPVEDTGQDRCWKENGAQISCSGTGQDGALQAGVLWPTPRLVDNGDGTVTDRLTGLVWLQNANCFGASDWTDALSDANGLMSGSCGLTDGSLPTDWRLPNVKELSSLIDFGESAPALPANHPFLSVQSSSDYWSSTSSFLNPGLVFAVALGSGSLGEESKNSTSFVWPVRNETSGAAVVAPTQIRADGAIESQSGGFIFPDGTIQTTAAPAAFAPVEDTGLWFCSDEFGGSIACPGTGQDADLQAGVDWPVPRFTANGDGTVTDHLTGLIWLQNADCFGVRDWDDARSDANGLASGSCGLTDSSVASEWRLPNVRELASLIDFGQGAPALPSGHPFSSVSVFLYWSSTTEVLDPARAFFVNLNRGTRGTRAKSSMADSYVWPVRGGL